LTDAIRDESQRLLDDNLAEPFAHELWREAWGLRLAHPRSALLIGVSALEVGIKHHIAKVVPDAEWLILELQSPPVHRLLNEYVPAVHDLDEGSLLTAEEKSLLRKSIERRNRITHAGDQTVDEQMLDNALHLIRGLLRRLDALRGHTWAALELPPAMHDDDGNLVE